MKNRYEFNIEDINKFTVVTKSDPLKYTIVCTREIIDKIPTRNFIVSHKAKDEEKPDGSILKICKYCGRWLRVDESKQTLSCFCNDKQETINEYQLIEYINSYLTKDLFEHVELYINDIYIH